MNINFENFKIKAKTKFGNKFCYSKFEYVNARSKGTIICKDHGDFEQSPDRHLNSETPCPSCLKERRSSQLKGLPNQTSEALHLKSQSNLKDFLKDNNIAGVLIVFNKPIRKSLITLSCVKCKCHEETTYGSLLQRTYPNLCKNCVYTEISSSKTASWDLVLKELEQKNPDYVYLKPKKYTCKKDKVEALCSKHGSFVKTVSKHLVQKCPKCTFDMLRETGKLPGGYCEKTFTNNPTLKEKPSTLYYVRIGNYFKIGITIKLENRLKSLKNTFNKEVQVIQTWSLPLYNAYLKEQEILLKFKEFRVFTELSTELFREDILKYL